VRGRAIDPAGYDAGKKIKGKKRHILVDTQGLLMHAIVHAADVQDRDGGTLLMAGLFGAFPFLIKLYADGGYQGPEFQNAMNQILARLDRGPRLHRRPHARARTAGPRSSRPSHRDAIPPLVAGVGGEVLGRTTARTSVPISAPFHMRHPDPAPRADLRRLDS
jgi:hypothetical protein